MKLSALLIAIVVVAVIAISWISPQHTTPATAAFSYISIKDSFFEPATRTINVGDIAFWTNDGAISHNITSDQAGLFGFPSLNPGFPYSFTFNTPGTYTYYCSFHSGMNGTIVVQNSSAPTATPPTETPAQTNQSDYLPIVLTAPLPPTPTPPSTLLTSVLFGTALASGNDCLLGDQLTSPISYPAGSTNIAYQIGINYPQVNHIQVSLVGSAGGDLTGETCSSYAVVSGQLYLARAGGIIRRSDGQALNPGTYQLRIRLNRSQTVDMPFTVR
jgi:plastocyanin